MESWTTVVAMEYSEIQSIGSYPGCSTYNLAPQGFGKSFGQALGHLLTTWETMMVLLAPGYHFLPWPFSCPGNWTSGQHISFSFSYFFLILHLSLSLALSNKWLNLPNKKRKYSGIKIDVTMWFEDNRYGDCIISLHWKTLMQTTFEVLVGGRKY